jgi:hypothetical protein
MRALLSAVVIVTASHVLPAQGRPADSGHSYTSAVGFSYEVPNDWKVAHSQVDPKTKEQAAQNAGSEQDKKGLACAQIGMTAQQGESVIVDVALPFDCFGQQMTEEDLSRFGDGASQGLKQSFDIGEPVYGSYPLGSHKLWIERVQGTRKDRPGISYTIEVACGVLRKGAVCWMAMAADDVALRAFEHVRVSLDGEKPAGLVPSTVFSKKP